MSKYLTGYYDRKKFKTWGPGFNCKLSHIPGDLKKGDNYSDKILLKLFTSVIYECL